MGLSTPQLRKAWKEYECAKEKMTAHDFMGDVILVAPPTVEAWNALAAVLNTHGYAVRTKDTDSYNCRAITGGTEKSLHSYGIALDINWQTNPFIDHAGKRQPRFSPRGSQDERALDVKAAKADTDMTVAMIEDVLAIKTKNGKRVFEWGGNWDGVKDAMHFELDIGPSDLGSGIDWSTVNGNLEGASSGGVPGGDAAVPAATEPVSTTNSNPAYTDAFLKCHVVIEKWEGGFVNHPDDPGGATNMGITKAVLESWRGHKVSVQDVKNLTREEARRIFYARYWRPLRADDLDLPLALMVYNCGVNSGPGRAGRFLQRVLNRQGAGLEEDGSIGQLTIKAAQSADTARAVKDFADTYEAFYKSLSTFNVFGKGWMNRLNEVLSIAASWLPAQPGSAGATEASSPAAESSMTVSGVSNMQLLATVPKEMTAIDKVLGGKLMLGKKTLAAGVAYAGTMLLQKGGALNLDPATYDTVVQLIALYGGLGLASKLERNK